MDCFVTLNTLAIYPLKEKVFLLERTGEICSTFLCLWRCYVVWSMKCILLHQPSIAATRSHQSIKYPIRRSIMVAVSSVEGSFDRNGCSSRIVVLHWDTSRCYRFDSLAGVAFVVGIECLRQLILRGVIPNKSDTYLIVVDGTLLRSVATLSTTMILWVYESVTPIIREW